MSNEDHDCIRPDERGLGADRDEAPVGGSRTLGLLQHGASRLADSICRTAVYVTRPHGGVGGGGREASPYPDWHSCNCPDPGCDAATPEATFAITPARCCFFFNLGGLLTRMNMIPLPVAKKMLFHDRRGLEKS